MKKLPILFLLLFISIINAQEKDTVKLKEVVVSGNRISLPFSKTSRTIKIVGHKEIQKSTTTNMTDLLQSISGLDVRRRGVDGMQSDLYIRGGSSDQTLLLIDGVKMSDPQTGHHLMNGILPLMLVEQIEVIKGPASRIYGQSAFAGAVNIVSKKNIRDALTINVNYGYFNNVKVETALSERFKNGAILAYAGYQKSDGYRYNTDFKNKNAFVKANLSNYQLVASFSDRKFGANGFYASPKFKDQYEETQTSLVSLSSKYKLGNLSLKPRLYWRRNHDMYLFLRHNPSYYKNTHLSNKVGAELNTVLTSSFGKTGVGVDVTRVFLRSSNLGNHERTSFLGFLEHRFEFLNDKLDVTPGVALSYYSDFGSNILPGIDIGYQLTNHFKLYANAGYTSRVPTYTDLYYKGRTNIGNPNLKPESAISEEFGVKYHNEKLFVNVALFHRKSEDLISWVKDNEKDPWQPQNFDKVKNYGVEGSVNYSFKGGKFHLNYTYMKDEVVKQNMKFSRYSLNSLKHQVNTAIAYQILPNLQHTVSYRFVQRTQGEKYQLLDTKLTASLGKKSEVFIMINNLFNEEYTETDLVPMPKGTATVGISWRVY
ncbi:MAG: TonB-dependent receptor [Flavobacteriaceae bacterium]|nr:TonB-dependent receptor [Flavobacteriaceae bacterium]